MPKHAAALSAHARREARKEAERERQAALQKVVFNVLQAERERLAAEQEALAKTPLIGSETDVHVQIGLDQLGQTRVDVVAVSRGEKGDWGRSKRLIGRFVRALDSELSTRPEQILDPTQHPGYLETA